MHFSLPQVVRGQGREQSRSAGFQPAVSPISNRQYVAMTLKNMKPDNLRPSDPRLTLPPLTHHASCFTFHVSRITSHVSPNPNGVPHISPVVATLRRLASLPWDNRAEIFPTLKAVASPHAIRCKDEWLALRSQIVTSNMKILDPPPEPPRPPPPEIGLHIKEDPVPYRINRRSARP